MGEREITNKLDRKYLVQDLSHERESDEDGGPRARFEIDSDFSYDSEEEARQAEIEAAEQRKIDPEKDWGKLLSKGRKKNNTGPKGVKADYEEARRIVRRQNETKALKDLERYKRMAGGATTSSPSVSYNSTKHSMSQIDTSSTQTIGAEFTSAVVREVQSGVNTSGKYVGQQNTGDEEEDDDAVLMKFRQLRLTQMRAKMSLPQFGRVKEVDKFQFLDEVDNAHPGTYVITHLYEDYINNCRRMTDVLKRLASRHSHVLFLNLQATDASQTLSHKALPAFLVYKAGKMVNEGAVDVVKTFFDGDPNFTDENVEWVLTFKYGIPLVGVDVSSSEQDTKGLTEHLEKEDESSTAQHDAEDSGYVSFQTKRQQQESDDDDW